MQRLNFTFDEATVQLLDTLSDSYYGGNKSLAVRAALQSLASHIGHAGWVVAGYTPVVIDHTAACHSCSVQLERGSVLYRPVFERGTSQSALSSLPSGEWLDCPTCAEKT